ncbi:hypothetical protein, partial [Kosakonia sp. S58]|uniref:hypothetical protein n=1 Tax=Kosakonia sp. S58 TaxID=2767457 RepID=UPI001F3DF872
AGIDKGSAAASLVPFTAHEIYETPPRLVNGTIPQNAICQAHCRMAAMPYPAYRTPSTQATCRNDCRMALRLSGLLGFIGYCAAIRALR